MLAAQQSFEHSEPERPTLKQLKTVPHDLDKHSFSAFLASRTPPLTPSKQGGGSDHEGNMAPGVDTFHRAGGVRQPSSSQRLPYVSTSLEGADRPSPSKISTASAGPQSASYLASVTSAGSSRFLLTVVPPAHLPHDPPHPRTNPRCNGYGPPEHFRRGVLIPLYPTLSGQLAAIAREYGLPSTGGLVLYLVSAVDPSSSTHASLPGSYGLVGEGGPRISEEAWAMLWNQLFEPDEDLAADQEAEVEDEADFAPPVPPVPAGLVAQSTKSQAHDEPQGTASDADDGELFGTSSETASNEGANVFTKSQRAVVRGFPPKMQHGLISPVSRASSSVLSRSLSNSRFRHASHQSVVSNARSVSGPARANGNRSPSSSTSSFAGNMSFGSALIVGKVEFDIDRTRAGKSKWYDAWIEGASVAPSQQPSPLLSVPDPTRFPTPIAASQVHEREVSQQALFLPNMLSQRDHDEMHETIDAPATIRPPSQRSTRSRAASSTASRVTSGYTDQESLPARESILERVSPISKHDSLASVRSAYSAVAEPTHVHREEQDEEEAQPLVAVAESVRSAADDEDTFVALPDVESDSEAAEPEEPQSVERATPGGVTEKGDPLADVLGSDASTWQQFSAESVSDSPKVEFATIDLSVEPLNLQPQADEEAVAVSKRSGFIVENLEPPTDDDLGLPPPQDDVEDVRSLLRSHEVTNPNLASPIHLASSPAPASHGAFEPLPDLEPLNAATDVEFATSELEQLARSRMTSLASNDSPPSAISARAARPERRGIADWSAIQAPVIDDDAGEDMAQPRVTSPQPSDDATRQSTVGLMDNLDDLERALAELSPNLSRSPGSQRSREESLAPSPLLTSTSQEGSQHLAPVASPALSSSRWSPRPSSPSTASFDTKLASPLLSSRKPFVYSSRREEAPAPEQATPAREEIDEVESTGLTSDILGYERNSPAELEAPSSPVAPAFSDRPSPLAQAIEPAQPAPSLAAASYTPPPRSASRKPRSTSLSRGDPRLPDMNEIPPVPARPSEESSRAFGLGIDGIMTPVDLDAVLPPPPPMKPIEVQSDTGRAAPATDDAPPKSPASLGFKSLRAARAWGDSSTSPKIKDLDVTSANRDASDAQPSQSKSPLNAFFQKSAFNKLFQKKGEESKTPLSPRTAPATSSSLPLAYPAEAINEPEPAPLLSPPLISESSATPAFLDAPVSQPMSTDSSARTEVTSIDEAPPVSSSEPMTPGPSTSSLAVYKTPQVPPLPYDGAEPVTNVRTPLALTSPRSEYDPTFSQTPRTPFMAGPSKFGYPASAPSTPAAWAVARSQQQADSKRFAPQRSRHRLSADIDNLLSQMNDMDFTAAGSDDEEAAGRDDYDDDDLGGAAEIEAVKRQIEEETRAPSPLLAFNSRPLTTGEDLAALLGKSMLSGSISPPTSPPPVPLS